jgi:Putative GTPase activating protein for Arf
LDAMVKKEENRFCADCGCREPRWASANLGIFICLSCSGIHRNLGVHISFVRSFNLDTWKTEQVDKMERLGNAKAKVTVRTIYCMFQQYDAAAVLCTASNYVCITHFTSLWTLTC